ncbi:MAG: acetate--CoA ligase family protein [Dehalococcoidia bacterium]|nr:acetate--CoA ligase family protein [Dehalococcoidia bacterium]MDW8120255.1 acetate--CoA ligase family protein [Chloroflexota bacterium]
MSTADLFATLRREGRTLLTEVEAKTFLSPSGIPIVPTHLARSAPEAVRIARTLGWPVVLKIVSPDIVHKSDIGGVKVNLTSGAAVARAYRDVMESARTRAPQARLHGVSVQRMAPPGVEVILGAGKDPQFGHYLMFGLGGVFVEVLKDVSFRLVPLTPRDARQMVREIRGFPLLAGYRGQPPVDLEGLEKALLALSAFLEQHPEVREIDLNPVFAYPQGCLAVDARVVLEESAILTPTGG